MSSFEELLKEFELESLETINNLLEDGSDPDAEYMIEHHVASTDFDVLEKVAIACFKKGYEVTDPEEVETEDGETIFSFDVIVEMELSPEAIMEDVSAILAICESFDVTYDGWGTYFEGDEE
ncbi:ribonuclease E inhibitor RraB [Motilimonas cestriensis]|uniref:Regulator of ribonuclease activity B n=1 Tax=Motilimonas cestriensis TaxID=2742685 RepID=A0ABS8WA73_9GAMM|nr:ribonuclease E inhibitor RraB [Motilimonas cestriensis]MCE2595912.1 ribonuclease E inhibitor RraB [Motilimonas cestriensis]